MTVVIPTLNEERFIGRCLTALTEIDYPIEKVEVRVVDNCSDDQTGRIALSFGARVIEVPKTTIAHSRNAGALDVQSDLVAFLDADCLPSPLWMIQAVRHFASAGVAAVGAYPSVLEGESNALQRTWAELCSRQGEGVHEVDWLPTANIIVRASFFKRVGGFTESLATCEDVDLGYRLRKHGTIIYDPDIKVYHLREPRTFKQFLQKEIWHAKNNVSGVFYHGLRSSELPSLVAPWVFAAGIMAGIMGIVLLNGLLMTGFPVALAVPLSYTVRGLKRTKRTSLVFVIYCVYFAARSFASIREMSLMLSSRRNAQTS